MKFVYAFLLLLFTIPVTAQPKKIFDFKSFPNLKTLNVNASFLSSFEFNGKIYFDGNDFGIGTELYTTDGTPQGTYLVKDISPGSLPGLPREYIVFNEQLYFRATQQGGNVTNIWKTDGTEEGTVQVGNARSVNDEYDFKVLNNELYFPGYTEEHGVELAKMDAAGNWNIVKDIVPGPTGSTDPFSTYAHTYALGVTSNYIYFNADDGIHGKELWRSDGTEAGTVLVKDINPSLNSISDNTRFIAIDDIIYFTADDGVDWIQLWRSNGTEAGTFAITNVDGNVSDLTVINDKIFFRVAGDAYVSSGTPGSEQQIGDGPETLETKTYDGFFGFHDEIYFVANGDNGAAVWKTDGTLAGTSLVGDLPNHNFTSIRYAVADDHLWLLIEGVEEQLLSVDENSIELVLEGDISQFRGTNPPWMHQNLPQVGDKIILFKNDSKAGYEPHAFNAKTREMTFLKDVNTEFADKPSNLKSAGGKAFFSANDGEHGRELWVTNGSNGGTKMVADLVPGSATGLASTISIFEDKAIFRVNAPNGPNDVWLSDGTENGTVLLKTFPEAGSSTSGISDFVTFNNTAYFCTSDGKLWKSNGTTNGTILVKDFGSSIQLANLEFIPLENTLCFLIDRYDLWSTDGTEAGTQKLKEMNMVVNQYVPRTTIYGKNKAYIRDRFSSESKERLWVSDGTTEGTKIVMESSIIASTSINLLLVVDDVAYFKLGRSPEDVLWRTDGTEEGTYAVGGTLEDLDVYTGFYTGSTIFVHASSDNQLWKTDGTNEGTTFAMESYPYRVYQPALFVRHLNNIYFNAISDERGSELWKTDPTGNRFDPVSEILPGPVGYVRFNEIVSSGNALVMLAQNGEIWSLDPTQSIGFEGSSDVSLSDSPITLQVTASSGLPVDLEVMSGNATLVGNTLTFSTEGPISIRASQPGNGDYDPASPVEKTFMVGPVLGLSETIPGITIFPNPATNSISVDGEFNSVDLYDMLGRNVFSGLTKATLEVGHLSRGLYILKFRHNDQIFSQKILLK